MYNFPKISKIICEGTSHDFLSFNKYACYGPL
jgi:hypothetical protein